jgi:hypothetical protein
VLSTYNDEKNYFLENIENKYSGSSNLTILKAALPDTNNLHNVQNIYLQSFSVGGAEKVIKTEYLIKLRSDEFYNNIENLLTLLPSNKISTCNVFLRNTSYEYFHLSDHIIIGSTKVLMSSFNNLKKYIETNGSNDEEPLQLLCARTPAEVKIFLFCFFSMENKTYNNWRSFSHKFVFNKLKQHFFVFDVDILGPYIIASSAVGVINDYKNFVNKDKVMDLVYMDKIEDMKTIPRFITILERIKNKIKKVVNDNIVT